MIYLLQVSTRDMSLFAKTEIDADSLEELKVLAKRMVKHNPEVKGETYRIFKIPVKFCGKWDTRNSVMLKKDVIAAL